MNRWDARMGSLLVCVGAAGCDLSEDVFDAFEPEVGARSMEVGSGAQVEGPLEVGPKDTGPDVAILDLADSGATHEAAFLPPCDVLAQFGALPVGAPREGSDAYLVPSQDARAAFARAVDTLSAGRAPRDEDLGTLNYRACQDPNDPSLLALIPVRPESGGARVSMRLGPARPLVAGAPHVFNEPGTLEQARELFDAGARAAIVSGTHRCANDELSSCDGRSTRCTGESSPYPVSDMAHTIDAFFQIAHERLAAIFAEAIFISFHGMSDPGVLLSNGTLDPVRADSNVARLATALASRFDTVTSCNEGTGAPPPLRFLCGTTNTQGRAVNASVEACGEPPPEASGRFIHVEQSQAVRARRAEVLAAFAEVF